MTATLSSLREKLDRALSFLVFPKETLTLRATDSAPGMLPFADRLFLYLCARHGNSHHKAVEIGSYKGLSAACLGLGMMYSGGGKVVACDPHLYPGSYPALLETISRLKMDSIILPRKQTSRECAATWREPIGILWIDGDHAYSAVQDDFRLWHRHLIPGGIIAFHDRTWAGPATVFREEILGSPEFCEAGALANIAYASKGFCANPELFRRIRVLNRLRKPFAQTARLLFDQRRPL